MDSGFCAVDSGCFVSAGNLDGIPDSLSCFPQAKIARIPDSTCRSFPDFGIRIPFIWGNNCHTINRSFSIY